MSVKVREENKSEPKHKFLFEPPEIVEVKSQKIPLNQPHWPYPTPAMHQSDGTVLKVCRMASVYATESMQFRAPTELTILYDLPPNPESTNLASYFRKWEINGFGTGAIVTRRYQAPHSFKYYSNWGIILHCNEHPNSGDYAPFQVRWFNPLQGNKRWEYEKCWAEDLIVIHQCLSKEWIIDIVEAQDAVAV